MWYSNHRLLVHLTRSIVYHRLLVLVHLRLQPLSHFFFSLQPILIDCPSPDTSICLENQGKYEEALADGATCLSMEPQFIKGGRRPHLQRRRDVFTQQCVKHGVNQIVLQFVLSLTMTPTPTPKNPGCVHKASAEKNLGKYVGALKTLQAGQHIDLGAFDRDYLALAYTNAKMNMRVCFPRD